MLRILTLCLLVLCTIDSYSFVGKKDKKENHASSPDREFRAAWIATVSNIDWPSHPSLSVEQKKEELINYLDQFQALNLNAVIFQVRPSCDALYHSHLEPWSKYLTGIQGQSPGFDPLEFIIKECHKRGMELHAWFNPYRVKQSLKENLSEDHVALLHPEWTFTYGNRMYFDPANPFVRGWLNNVVKDVVRRYDVDAIHFDDYFYPYPIPGKPLPDDESFEKFNRGYSVTQKNEWRRNNVDLIIEQLSKTIKDEKPWVKFGVSPFGVWRNKNMDPQGSDTRGGITNYDHLYADVILWQKNGWIDYLMPQLYWEINHKAADYKTLAHWWAKESYNRGMYIGLSPYKLDSSSKTDAWRSATAITDQIELNRSIPEIQGEGYFSAKHFNRDILGLPEKLQENYYQKRALIPTMPWIDDTPPLAPTDLMYDKESYQLSWNPIFGREMDRARFYVIFEYDKRAKTFPTDSKHVVGITDKTTINIKTLVSYVRKKRKVYRVTSIDRLSNMSELSEKIKVRR